MVSIILLIIVSAIIVFATKKLSKNNNNNTLDFDKPNKIKFGEDNQSFITETYCPKCNALLKNETDHCLQCKKES